MELKSTHLTNTNTCTACTHTHDARAYTHAHKNVHTDTVHNQIHGHITWMGNKRTHKVLLSQFLCS